MNILLIEDDIPTSQMYAYRLKESGHTVVECASGADGLKTLEATTFDMILLDVMLPEMDGITFLKTVREHEDSASQQHTPVVILSNLGQDEVVQECLQYDIKGYLIKARYTPTELAEKLQELFGAENSEQLTGNK